MACRTSSAGLYWTGRSSKALNSAQLASSSKKCRRSARTSRACATVAHTVKVVRSVPSTSAARRNQCVLLRCQAHREMG